MNNIELLAPAGSMESLIAAVQCGADAVYLGGNKFSARAYASNFDNQVMEQAVDYCHLYGVRVYVTINTLLKENEIQEAKKYAEFLYNIGVDALIVQDVGFVNIVKNTLPDFEIHASTQLTIHNGEGARLYSKEGFKRIVLARELSFNEVKEISIDMGIETEIFVHGALCICYSGQCLLSSLIGGRSGNRGRCAQPCRLPYTLINKNTGEEKKAYLLSPKDTSFIEDIPKLLESGTSSLKIEGRMKKPEYVAGVVSAYRKLLDKEKTDMPSEKKKLLKLFNREGFSKAYFYGNTGKDMMAYSFPKNTGIEIGTADDQGLVLLKEDVMLQDGIRALDTGFTLNKIIKNGKEVENACVGDRVKLLPSKFKEGEIIYKTSDFKLLEDLSDFYKDKFKKKIILNLDITFKVGEPIVLEVIYNNQRFKVQGETVQKALNKPLSKDKLLENINKTGSTVFAFDGIKFISFEEGFLPVSLINEGRRSLLAQIENTIINSFKRQLPKERENNELKEQGSSQDNNQVLVVVHTKAQLDACRDLGIKRVAIDLYKRKEDIKLDVQLDKLGDMKVYFKIPNIIKEEFQIICNKIEEYKDKIAGIVTSNAGIINRYHQQLEIIGDYKFNIFNSSSVDFYKKYLKEIGLSVELNKKELLSLLKASNHYCNLLIYGKIEVMVSEYCAIGSVFGGKCQNQNCSKPCEKADFVLEDRTGTEVKILTDKFCRSYIYNSVTLNLIDNIRELKNIKKLSFRMDFIDESYEETTRILKAYAEECYEDDFTGYTRGHYKRGVE